MAFFEPMGDDQKDEQKTASMPSAEERAQLAEASEALEAGQIDHAISIYRALVASDGAARLSAMLGLAVCHARRREWEEAEQAFLALLQRTPDLAVARAYLGMVRFELGRLDEAQDDLKAAIDTAPGNAVVRLKHAEMLLRLGRLHDAYDELQRSARLSPPDKATREYTRTLLLATRKQLAHAVTHTGAAPRQLWHRIFNSRGAMPLAPSSALPDAQA